MIMPISPERAQEGDARLAVEVAVAIKMRKFRTLLSVLLLLESRSLQVKLIKAAGLLLKPTPAFVKSVHAWMPALTGIVCTHALSGATTEVKSSIGDSVTLRVGEELDFEFVTSRYFAQSFRIEGLPVGIPGKKLLLFLGNRIFSCITTFEFKLAGV